MLWRKSKEWQYTFCLFLGIAVQKFSYIFDFGWQIINWAACIMTSIFMNPCIFRSSEIALLSYYFCYCNLWLHINTSQLIESNFYKLITNWEVHSYLLTCSLAKFFLQHSMFNNCSYFAMGLHFINDLTEWMNLYLSSTYCCILNFS